MNQPSRAALRPASGLQALSQTFKALVWSFFGVRRAADCVAYRVTQSMLSFHLFFGSEEKFQHVSQ